MRALVGRRSVVVGLTALAVSCLTACAAGAPTRASAAELDASITVASFNFAESALLGELYATALAGAGHPVDRQLRLGAREIVQPALVQGMVDLVPEYVGSALSSLEPDGRAPADPAEARGRLAAAYGDELLVLRPAAAQNQNGFVVRRETAEALDLRTLSDLAPVAGRLVFGGPPECHQRRLCLGGLEEVYGIDFAAVESLDSSGPLTFAALGGGRVDVALLFTTSGALADDHLVLLADDRRLQPPENVVPVLRRAIVRRHGREVADIVDAVTERLDEPTLVALNRRLDRGEEPAAVAAGWLSSQGLG